jgi:predicted metal-dependent hydrolase
VSTESLQLMIGGMPVEVRRRDIRNLHVGVYPPAGRIRVSAPLRLSAEAVRLAVVSRLAWIRRQQKSFQAQARQTQRDMVSGESHYFLGRRYRLSVQETAGRPGVQLRGVSILEIRVRPGSDVRLRETLLTRWYRERLRDLLPPLLAKWKDRVGRQPAEVRIKRMKTRWGSCNQPARRIWLNLELVKKPPQCLEYILVHELVHLRVREHDDQFRQFMDGLMPGWRGIRDELNQAPLAHEEWRY